jgi:hypothetical protein
MPQVLLVNPKRRRGRRKMSALQRKYFGKRNPTRSRKRRSPRSNPALMLNRGRHSRRFRRNPAGLGLVAQVGGNMTPTLIGAGGALAADVAIGFLPLPAALQAPAFRPLIKGAVAVALGLVASMATNRSTGAKVMVGALTVVVYDALRGVVQRVAPQIPLGGLAENEYPQIAYAGDPGDGMGEVIEFPASDADAMGELIDPLGELVELGEGAGYYE